MAKAAGSPTTTNSPRASPRTPTPPQRRARSPRIHANSAKVWPHQVSLKVCVKAGLFAEASGKAGAPGESTTALAAKVAPVLDSTVAKATGCGRGVVWPRASRA